MTDRWLFSRLCAPLRSRVRSLLILFSPFLKDPSFRYYSSAVDIFLGLGTSSYSVLCFCRFLKHFNYTLHTMPICINLFANSSLGIPSLGQRYYFMPVRLCHCSRELSEWNIPLVMFHQKYNVQFCCFFKIPVLLSCRKTLRSKHSQLKKSICYSTAQDLGLHKYQKHLKFAFLCNIMLLKLLLPRFSNRC